MFGRWRCRRAVAATATDLANRPDGFWIAESDLSAARHAITHTIPAERFTWAVLATDGAYGPLLELSLDDWPVIATYSDAQLANLLQRCADWGGRHRPSRAETSKGKAVGRQDTGFRILVGLIRHCTREEDQNGDRSRSRSWSRVRC